MLHYFKYFMMLILTSCGASSGVDSYSVIPSPRLRLERIQCDEGTSLTYENFGESFMAKYCVRCHSSHLPREHRHGAPLNINLETYEDMHIHRTNILKSAARRINPRMPPSRHVSAEERELLAEWLNCGVPGESY